MTRGQGATSLDIPVPTSGQTAVLCGLDGPYGLKLLSDSNKLCILCAYKICGEEKP